MSNFDDNIISEDWGTKQRKVAITITETADGAEFEVYAMTAPGIWTSGTKITDTEFEENRTLLFMANRILADIHAKIDDNIDKEN